MRLERFRSAGRTPLGEGAEKKVYENPENPERVIAVIKEPKERLDDKERYSTRQLKGAYYLTKIAHILLPERVPDIYQAGASADGQQTFDRERIAQTPEHESLQAARRVGADESSAVDAITKEMGKEMHTTDRELEKIGLGFAIDDANVANYSRDEEGNVRYLEPFIPWVNVGRGNVELNFDTKNLARAIKHLPDEALKLKCKLYVERISALFEEDATARKETYLANLDDCEPGIKRFEAMLAEFEATYDVQALLAIQTEAEAMASMQRKNATAGLGTVLSQLQYLGERTNIPAERHTELYDKYKRLTRAIGIIGRDGVDHNR